MPMSQKRSFERSQERRGNGYLRMSALASLATFGVLVGALVLSGSALAAENIGVTGTFGSAISTPSNPEPLSSPAGVAVNQASEDVYVVDQGNDRVEYFSATGSYIGKFNASDNPSFPAGFSSPREIAIDNSCYFNGKSGSECASLDQSNGDVYVSDLGNGVIDKLSATGSYISQLNDSGGVQGIAVDGSGNLWVYEANGNVNELSDAGVAVKTFNTGRGVSPDLAVDSTDNLYLAFGCGCLGKYNLSGEQLAGSETEAISPVSGLAVDLATNDLYVGQGGSLVQYGPFGEPFSEPVHRSVSTSVASGSGIGVNSTNHEVYVADSASNDVAIFKLRPPPPAPTTQPASQVAATTAMLHGELNPEGSAVDFYFSYNTGGSCLGAGSITTPLDNGGDPATGSSPVKESALITDLEPTRQYTFCLFASDAFGASAGSTQELTTVSASPLVDGESVAAASSTGATLEAQVNPNNQETHYSFEYSTEATGETLEGSVTKIDGASPLAAEFGDRTASVPTGAVLEAGTTYFYRVVAENGTPPATDGAVRSFTTVPAPLTEAASEVTGTTAVLNGTLSQVDSEGEPGYHFESNTGTSCGGEGAKTTTAGTIAKGSKETVKTEVTELAPRTQYTFCLVATNAFGSTTGSELSFTTGAAKPIVEEQTSPEQTTSGAKLTALINPSGASTTCKVEYGLDASYGSEMPCAENLGEGLTGQPASLTLTGLQPHQTYHYRFLAANEIAEGEGVDETFKTQVAHPVIVQAPGAPVVGRVNALLAGVVNPENTLVFYHFVYGTTTQYGSGTPVTEGGSGLGAERVSQVLEGLKPGTTYHFAFVASNPAGSETSVDGTFRTGPATPPVAFTDAASDVTTTSVTLAGNVNPDSLATTYTFQIGADATYGGELSGVAASGAEAVAVSATFDNLQPGTLYHYRVLASNEDGTSYGADQTFSTAGVPGPLVQPPVSLLITIPEIQFPATESTTTTPSPKALTNAQKLASALKACKKKPRSKRVGCVRQAHRKYPITKKKVSRAS